MKEKLICPYCDGPLRLIKKTYQIGDLLLHGTEMYECPLCESVMLSPEQTQDIARRAKRTKEKKRK